MKELPAYTGENPPQLSIVMPARNEAESVRRALESLAQQDYSNFEVLFVNDRSEDATGEYAEAVAREHPETRIQVIHVSEVPPGWLGKCNALQTGANSATGEYLLFTDADVVYEQGVLSRAMACMEREKADMLVTLPEMESSGFWERVLLSAFMRSFVLVYPPWRAANDRSTAYIGVGAFNLIRRKLYQKIGGHKFLRLQVLDDVGLGKIVKKSGGRLRVCVGSNMLRVRWYSGLRQMIRGLEKNAFAAMDFSITKTLIATLLMLFVNCWPVAGIFFGPVASRIICAVTALIIQPLLTSGSRQGARFSWIYGFTASLGSILMAAVLLRSAAITVRQKGIRWRNSFYPLKELKQFKL
jgi:cellulose synthase/poly-beta-1,6-N-acetylglucosamine synthase-like glycosyltransferase